MPGCESTSFDGWYIVIVYTEKPDEKWKYSNVVITNCLSRLTQHKHTHVIYVRIWLMN